MRISRRVTPLVLAWGLFCLGAPCVAKDYADDVAQRICANLDDESRRVLDDNSDTSKYLSPYIAAEIYQQVVAKSLEQNATELAAASVPAMAALPCGDTVSGFLMAIKRRMEYNRFDYFVMRYRGWIGAALLIALLSGGFYLRQRQKLAKQASTGTTL